MSEKLRPNFTPIPNVILDEIMCTLKPAAVKVLFAICRFTYGWGKQSDRISLKQLSEITGIKDRGNVHHAIKQLGNLIIVNPGDPSKNEASEYSLNIKISNTDLLSLKQQDLLSPVQQPLLSSGQQPVVKNTAIQRKKNISPKGDISRRSARPTADPRVKKLLNSFCSKFEARIGKTYAPAWAKDGANLKRLLAAGADPADIERLMDRYFETEFHRKTGFDVSKFVSAFNSLNSAGTKKKHNYEDGKFPELP